MLNRSLLLLVLTIGGCFSGAGCSTLTQAAEERVIAVMKDAGEKVFQAAKDKAAEQLTVLSNEAKAKISEHMTTLAASAAEKIGKASEATISSAQAKADEARKAYDASGSQSDYAKYLLWSQIAMLLGGAAGALHLGSRSSKASDVQTASAEAHANATTVLGTVANVLQDVLSRSLASPLPTQAPTPTAGDAAKNG